MSDLNVLALVGRISQDAVLKTSASDTAYCNFSIAVSRSRKKDGGAWEDIPHFFNLSLYGARAEGLSPYLIKGQTVSVQGHLEQSRWESDGVMHSRTSIAIDDLHLVGAGPRKPGYAAAGSGENGTGAEEADPDLDLGSRIMPEGEAFA
jgi:single-strand DNA-binding protein